MSFHWCYFTCLFLLVGLGVELSNAQIHRRGTMDVSLPYKKIGYSTKKIIIVDPKGQHGSFSTIQSAIDSIPSNNSYWTSINIKEGIYREKLKIPYDKPYIIIQGAGLSKTKVEWNDHASTLQSPTFFTMADNIVVRFISFRNSYNNPRNSNPWAPAVAAMVSGDKTYFYNVGFFGFQDTLWDDQGRHYYKNCMIQGAVDFIFGAGQSIYEGCSISVIASALGQGIAGFITAQARTGQNDANGFVFKKCIVHGDGTTYLGRPWRAYARVLFYKTNMSDIVVPTGWAPWDFADHEKDIQFSEYGNIGAGSKTDKRVKWLKKLDWTTVNLMASDSFVDNEGWLKIASQI